MCIQLHNAFLIDAPTIDSLIVDMYIDHRAAFELPHPRGVEAHAGRLAPLRVIVLPPPLRGWRLCRGSPLRGYPLRFFALPPPLRGRRPWRGSPLNGCFRVRTALGLVFAFLSKIKTVWVRWHYIVLKVPEIALAVSGE